MIWDATISFFNESYIIFAISSFVNLTPPFCWNNKGKGQIASLILATLSLLIVLGYPIYVLVFFMKKFKRLPEKEFREKFGSMYLHLRFKESIIKLLEPFYSTIRRLILAATLVFLLRWPAFQIIATVYSWCAIVILNGQTMPFPTRKEFFME